jgi:tRNA G18 (ribose-2'-O)-methylase SpoU
MAADRSDVLFISDPADPLLDDYRELKDATRRRSGTFIAESERVILRLFGSPFGTRSVLLTPSRYERLEPDIPPGVTTFVAHEDVINSVVGFPMHRGAVALGVRPPSSTDTCALEPSARVVVIVEDVVDPDNIGAVFRHSAAFGVDAVVLSPHAGDPLYRKALRAAVGWSLHVPWWRASDALWPALLTDLRADGWHVLALTPAHDALVLPAVLGGLEPAARVALLVGTEHDGLTQASMDQANVLARIPMADGVDSLNVATTVGIALYELAKRDW